jgi:hypothetical protein
MALLGDHSIFCSLLFTDKFFCQRVKIKKLKKELKIELIVKGFNSQKCELKNKIK